MIFEHCSFFTFLSDEFLYGLYHSKKVREKSRECHNHKPQPFPDPKRKRKPTNLNKHKPNKRTKSTKISSLFPKRGNRNTKRTEKQSKAVVPVLVLLFVALWFILRGDIFYVLPCVILFLCFFSPFSIGPWIVCINCKIRPRWLSWMRRPTGDLEVAGSTPAEVGNILSWRLIRKYFLLSFSPFRWFKKGSCQYPAKECAQYWLTA